MSEDPEFSKDPTMPFFDAYPAPWSIKDDSVVDAGGDDIIVFADDDAQEKILWQGVVDAVNANARLEQALRMARAL